MRVGLAAGATIGTALAMLAACSSTESPDLVVPGACVPATCASLGKHCGTWTDGCGGELLCGSCTTGHPCVDGTCGGCTPWTCDRVDKHCGAWSDGCGSVLECGTCPPGATCDDGRCSGPCELISHFYLQSPPQSHDTVEIAQVQKEVEYFCPSDPQCLGTLGDSYELFALSAKSTDCSQWQFLYRGTLWFHCAGEKAAPATAKVLLLAGGGQEQVLCPASEVEYDPTTGHVEVDCHADFSGTATPAPSEIEPVFLYQDAKTGYWYVSFTAYQSLSCP